MAVDSLYQEILAGIKEIPILDVHSHISADHPQANDLSDILFYHFVRREVYSAGLPDDNFLVSQAPLSERMAYFLPYLEYIENTTTFWCLRKISEDIYGIAGGINQHNWKRLKQRIEEKREDGSWPRKVMDKANIEHSLICESKWNRENLERYPFFSPLFEDLEYFNFDPQRGLSLLDLVKKQFGYLPSTLGQVEDLLAKLFQQKVEKGISYFACFISTTLQPIRAERQRIEKLYQGSLTGKKLNLEERNVVVTWLLGTYLVATDAYSVEWAYGKVNLVLDCLARVLSEKIEQGYLSQNKAFWLARRILYDNPKEIYGL